MKKWQIRNYLFNNNYPCRPANIIIGTIIIIMLIFCIPRWEKSEQVNTELVGKVHADFRVNSEWVAQAVPELQKRNWDDRMNEMLIRLWREEDVKKSRWMRVWYKHWIKPPVLVCIAKADTTLGKYLKSKNNIGNVWNNDRWDTVDYWTPIAWIDAIGRVLNNRYLGYKQSIWSLSVWGGGSAPFYATSPENWNNNVLNCLSEIYDEVINEDFMIRL